MLVQPTIEKLKAMKLDRLAQAWQEQQKSAELLQLAFDERFSLLVDAQYIAQQNKRMDRSLKQAKLKLSNACLEALDYAAARGLDRAHMRQLATGRWIVEHLNCVVTGPTGVGKTFVGCALAQLACRLGHRALSWSTRTTPVCSARWAVLAKWPASTPSRVTRGLLKKR